MRQSLQALFALLLASFILYAGNGLQGTLLAVRGNLESFALSQIGLLLSAYAAGFIAGCRFAPALVMRVGHIRTFTALASVASASALGHAMYVDAGAWMLLRVITGFCMAGLSMVIESWINEKATNANRGQILSVYRVVDLGAVMLGQSLLALASPEGFVLFALLSILISLSLVPVALTTSIAPRPIEVAHLDLPALWRTAPLAMVGCFATGAANGAFWAVGPVFVLRMGYETAMVALFMTVAVFAGTVSQWPLGYLSDRIDRRKVLIAITISCAGTGIILALTAGFSHAWLLGGGALYGFFAFAVFGLSAAHAHDYAEPGRSIETSAGLLLSFGVGSVAGPLIAPQVMQLAGNPALFIYTSAVYLAVSVFGLYRLSVRQPAAEEHKEHYVPLVESTPVMFELDPRAPELVESDAADTPAEADDAPPTADDEGAK